MPSDIFTESPPDHQCLQEHIFNLDLKSGMWIMACLCLILLAVYMVVRFTLQRNRVPPLSANNKEFLRRQVADETQRYDTSRFNRGDLLAVSRLITKHFGIYLGDNKVAHLMPDVLLRVTQDQNRIQRRVTFPRLILGLVLKAASVRMDSVEDFASGAEISINETDTASGQQPLDSEEVACRAEKLLGATKYSLLWNNCEHFATFCRYGTGTSCQTARFNNAVMRFLVWEPSAFLVAVTGLGFTYLLALPSYTIYLILSFSLALWMAS